MKILSKLAGMTWPGRLALVDAGLPAEALGMAVRIRSFEGVRRAAHRPTRPRPRWRSYALHALPRAGGGAGRRFFPGHPCPSRALAVPWRAHRSGLATGLRIGIVRSEAGKLEAGGRVEHDGRLLSGGTESPDRYSPLQRLGGRG